MPTTINRNQLSPARRIALIGAGMFSTSLFVPIMRREYDDFKAEAMAQGNELAQNADAIADYFTFLKVAAMPAILLVISL